MTSLTTLKIIAPENPRAVMTTHTTLGAFRGQMLCRNRRRYLFALREPGLDLMTIAAIQLAVFAMFCVAEIDLKSFRKNLRPTITAESVTSAAGRNISPGRLGARRVALVASGVGVET